MPDDASQLLGGAGEVSGNVFKGDDGDVEGVTEADEFARLVRGVDVETPRHVVRLVGDDAEGDASHPGKSGDDVLRPEGLDFQEAALVHDGVQHGNHVVGLVGIRGNEVPQLGVQGIGVFGGLCHGGVLHVVRRKVAQQPTDLGKALRLVLGEELGHTGLGVVGHGAADLLAGHVLSRHRLDDCGARDVHDAHFVDHKNEVCQRGAVHRPSGAGTGNDGNLGHHAGRQHVTEEDVAVSRQGVHGLLDASAAGIVDADDGSSVLHRQVHDLADFSSVHLPQRSPHDGEILAVDVHDTAVDGAVARHHAVSGENGLLQSEVRAAVLHEFVDLRKASLVQQFFNALPGRELALLMLLGNGLFSAAGLRRLSLGQHLLTELVDVLLRHALPPP